MGSVLRKAYCSFCGGKGDVKGSSSPRYLQVVEGVSSTGSSCCCSLKNRSTACFAGGGHRGSHNKVGRRQVAWGECVVELVLYGNSGWRIESDRHELINSSRKVNVLNQYSNTNAKLRIYTVYCSHRVVGALVECHTGGI